MSARRSSKRPIAARAVPALRAADPVLRDLIDRVGPIESAHEPDLWWSLVDAIVGQQLSVKAAATISGRVAALSGNAERPSPTKILSIADDSLRAAGLSRAKTSYVKDLATKWLDNTLEPDRIPSMSDDEVIEHLTRVKGIGRWTAEMVLIFTLQRPDVWPVDDLGIRVAVQRAYGLPDRPGRAQLEELGEAWKPYRSVASLYLWRSLKLPIE